jgi:hypothetical protein
MESLKEILVVLKKPDGETVVIREPDFVSYPNPSQPYWTIVKEKTEIRTSGEVWVEKAMRGNEVVCEDSVVCTGMRCFHKLPHPKAEDCGKFCELDRAANCKPYRI